MLGSIRDPFGLGGAPSCKPAGLVAHFFLEAGGFFGLERGSLTLKNRGNSSCSLPAWPQVSLQWKGEDLASLPERRLVGYQPDPAMRLTRTLHPGRWAFVPLSWDNWCKPKPWVRGAFPLTLRLRLPSGAKEIRMRRGGVAPECVKASSPSVFTVGGFYTPLPTGWTP